MALLVSQAHPATVVTGAAVGTFFDVGGTDPAARQLVALASDRLWVFTTTTSSADTAAAAAEEQQPAAGSLEEGLHLVQQVPLFEVFGAVFAVPSSSGGGSSSSNPSSCDALLLVSAVLGRAVLARLVRHASGTHGQQQQQQQHQHQHHGGPPLVLEELSAVQLTLPSEGGAEGAVSRRLDGLCCSPLLALTPTRLLLALALHSGHVHVLRILLPDPASAAAAPVPAPLLQCSPAFNLHECSTVCKPSARDEAFILRGLRNQHATRCRSGRSTRTPSFVCVLVAGPCSQATSAAPCGRPTWRTCWPSSCTPAPTRWARAKAARCCRCCYTSPVRPAPHALLFACAVTRRTRSCLARACTNAGWAHSPAQECERSPAPARAQASLGALPLPPHRLASLAGPGFTATDVECLEFLDALPPPRVQQPRGGNAAADAAAASLAPELQLSEGPWSCRYVHPSTRLLRAAPATPALPAGLLVFSSTAVALITTAATAAAAAPLSPGATAAPHAGDVAGGSGGGADASVMARLGEGRPARHEVVSWSLEGVPTCLAELPGDAATGALRLLVGDSMAGEGRREGRLLGCVAQRVRACSAHTRVDSHALRCETLDTPGSRAPAPPR